MPNNLHLPLFKNEIQDPNTYSKSKRLPTYMSIAHYNHTIFRDTFTQLKFLMGGKGEKSPILGFRKKSSYSVKCIRIVEHPVFSTLNKKFTLLTLKRNKWSSIFPDPSSISTLIPFPVSSRTTEIFGVSTKSNSTEGKSKILNPSNTRSGTSYF